MNPQFRVTKERWVLENIWPSLFNLIMYKIEITVWELGLYNWYNTIFNFFIFLNFMNCMQYLK